MPELVKKIGSGKSTSDCVTHALVAFPPVIQNVNKMFCLHFVTHLHKYEGGARVLIKMYLYTWCSVIHYF
jgi:hypothetical protein